MWEQLVNLFTQFHLVHICAIWLVKEAALSSSSWRGKGSDSLRFFAYNIVMQAKEAH